MSVKNWVQKVVITIPFMAYFLVATQSVEGMIILGLVVLFLIILYVIAELCKKDPEEDYEYEDARGDRRRIKTAKELKLEEKARAKQMKREDKELLHGDKERRKQARKEEKKSRKKIRTGGFVDEIYEDELEETSVPEKPDTRPASNMQAAASEAHELLKKEIAAATAEEEPAAEEIRQETVSEAIPEAEEPVEATEPEEPVEIKRLAIPRYTASQLADKARKAGDAPDIVRDSITKVTLLDYSDIIGGDEEIEE